MRSVFASDQLIGIVCWGLILALLIIVPISAYRDRNKP